MPTSAPRNVAILIFDEVEVLDFAGPFEVFSVTGQQENREPFRVFTVAEHARPVLARNELSINPRHTIADCPPPDLLVVPGGFGTRQEMNNATLIDWIRRVAADAELTLSVCTGALLLAKAGLLDGQAATTHFAALDLLERTAPNTAVRRDQRIVDNGAVIVAAGVSAGIDMALYTVARLLGDAEARETARYMEYDWRAQARPEPVQNR